MYSANVAEFGRYAAGQIIVLEIEKPQLGEVAELRRDAPIQFVALKIKPP